MSSTHRLPEVFADFARLAQRLELPGQSIPLGSVASHQEFIGLDGQIVALADYIGMTAQGRIIRAIAKNGQEWWFVVDVQDASSDE